MKRFIISIFFYLNIIAAIALLLSYTAQYISPDVIKWLPFFGLAYPYFLILNLIFVVFWIFITNIRFLLSIFIILIGWQNITNLVQFNKPQKIESTDKNIKLLSYNVRLFDLYNWSNNKKTRNKIFDFVKAQDADIICFQEFYQDNTKSFLTLDTIVKLQEAKYFHVNYTTNVYGLYYFGIATFSKYPIVNRGSLKFENTNNTCIYTDIKIGADTIRVYNNHLESIHFNKTTYNFIDSINSKKDEEKITGILDITNRLKKAFLKRTKQVDIISNSIKTSPYKMFVCGDFNDTPFSYTYKNMSKDLKDSFKELGFGFGTTYNRKLLFMRIDYLLHSPEIIAQKFETTKIKLSDHYPIIGVYSISKTDK